MTDMSKPRSLVQYFDDSKWIRVEREFSRKSPYDICCASPKCGLAVGMRFAEGFGSNTEPLQMLASGAKFAIGVVCPDPSLISDPSFRGLFESRKLYSITMLWSYSLVASRIASRIVL